MAKQATGLFDYVSPSGRTFFNKGRQYTSPTPQRSGKTIDPSPLMGKPAAAGATLASRPIEGGPALPANKAYNPIIDAESGEDPNAPRVETQQPIENRGGSARYMIQGGGPKIDLSFLVPERANKSFDPSKAIGGENVPYQESKGVGGFLRRLLGDESNKQNIEAQQVQGAKWEAEAARTKERAERKQDLLEEIDAREKGLNKRFDATEARLTKGDETAARERQLDRDRAFLEGNRTWISNEDKARREEARDTATQGFQNRQVTLAEDVAKLPNFQGVSTGQGGVLLYDQKSGRPQGTFSQPTIGEVTDAEGNKSYVPTGGGYKPYVEPVKAPINPKPGGGAVDRTNGLTPLGGPLPPPPAAAPAPAPAPPNTALVPRFMRGAGDVIGEGVQSFTDPLRSGATGLNQLLFNSGAQQDPEVLKRMEERARRNPLRRPDSYGEAGY